MTTVRVSWNIADGWNEVTAWVMENFGLTGDRYMCHMPVEGLDFVFTDEADAIMFMLRWPGRIVTENELTVQYVSKFLSMGPFA